MNEQAIIERIKEDEAITLSKLITLAREVPCPNRINLGKHRMWVVEIDKDHTANIYMHEDDYKALMGVGK